MIGPDPASFASANESLEFLEMPLLDSFGFGFSFWFKAESQSTITYSDQNALYNNENYYYQTYFQNGTALASNLPSCKLYTSPIDLNQTYPIFDLGFNSKYYYLFY